MFSVLPVQRFSARTLPALLRSTAKRVPMRQFVRELPSDGTDGEPRSCTFSDFEHAVAATAQGLHELGVTAGDRILFVAENSLAWQVVAWAAQALRAETCAAFSNLAPAALCDIALRVRPRCLFVGNDAQFGHLDAVRKDLVADGLKLLITPGPIGSPAPELTHRLAAELAETAFDPSTWEQRIHDVAPSDPFLVLFTSGTTGRQKGVRLSHDAFVRSLEGGQVSTGMTEADDGLMFLPFAHVAGQCQFALSVALGHSLIMVSRREDLPRAFALGPTYVFAVPMVYEKLRERVINQVAARPWPVRGLLRASLGAINSCEDLSSAPLSTRFLVQVGKKTIGKRLRSQLGGRLRMVASGGAETPVAQFRFFEALGIPYVSLYGMTETCGLISSGHVDGPRLSGSVGKASADLTLHISAAGELCVKGPMLMRGYLEPEDDALAVDESGFFHTGDLVACDPATRQLRIVGRSKHVIVLSTGKKLSPEPLEAKLCTLPLVQAALLVGDGRPCVCAILFVQGADLARLDPNIRTEPLRLVESVKVQLAEFSEFERPKRLLIVPRMPAEFPEFLTPTFKLRRAAILAHLADAIERLYTTDSSAVSLLSLAPGV